LQAGSGQAAWPLNTAENMSQQIRPHLAGASPYKVQSLRVNLFCSNLAVAINTHLRSTFVTKLAFLNKKCAVRKKCCVAKFLDRQKYPMYEFFIIRDIKYIHGPNSI
jgi:hypothetical protein